MSASTHHPFSRRLDLEWAHLRTHRSSLAVACRWPLPGIDPDRLDDLQQIVQATQRDAGPIADVILCALADVGRTDQLAARVLLQRLLGGLIAQSARFRFLCEGVDPVEVAVPALWVAIRRFDTSRRSAHVAPALISDAIYLAFRKGSTRAKLVDAVEPFEFDARPASADEHAVEELARVVRLARDRGVAEHHLELICHLVRAGTPTAVARERRVTTRTVRNHRDRAVVKVRQALAA